MSLEPLSKSLGAVIDERLSSPLTSSFVIAWSLWNYKIFFILFSARSLEYKFDAVAKQFAGMDFLVNGFGIPMIATLLYIYALPIPAQKVYRVWRENLRKNDDIRVHYDALKPVSSKEAEGYRQRVRDLEDELERLTVARRTDRADLQSKNTKVAELEAAIASMDTEVNESRSIRNHAASVTAQLTSAESFLGKQQKWLRSLINAAKIDDPKLDERFNQFEQFMNNISANGAMIGMTSAQQVRLNSVVADAVLAYRNEVKKEATRVSREIVLAQIESGKSTNPRGTSESSPG